MNPYMQQVIEPPQFIRKRIHADPEYGLVTGTGLAVCAEAFEPIASIPYRETPHFPFSTLSGHPGRIQFGSISGKQIIVMQGRCHLYEGYSPGQVVFPIRVMQELGVRILILSNAAGGVNPQYYSGDILIIPDHINLTGSNSLAGPNEDHWGVRFPDMGLAYDPQLIRLAATVSADLKIPIKMGVYAGLHGPSLETPAEIRYLRLTEGGAVGFSTVHETIAAVHARMAVLGISIITNVHNPEKPEPTTVEAVISVAEKAGPSLTKLIRQILLSF